MIGIKYYLERIYRKIKYFLCPKKKPKKDYIY